MSNGVDETVVRERIAQWNAWLAHTTDVLLSLEERCRTAGSQRDRDDVAAAFVARKAIADRLTTVTPLVAHHRDEAAAQLAAPLVDDLGGAVGKDVADAARLVDAILGAVEARVGDTEHRQVAAVEQSSAIDADLAAADRLATELGEQHNYVAQLRRQFAERRDLAALSGQAAELRHALETADSARRRLLDSLAGAPDRLLRLATVETEVRELALRCRSKIAAAPTLGVPAVAAIDAPPSIDEVRLLPWPAARARIEPYLTRIDRLGAALAEARRRFQGPLEARDDLRGLLESYRSKAAAHGLGEAPDVEPLYRAAKDVLWTAPCDVRAARPLVDRYVATVNERIAARPATRETG